MSVDATAQALAADTAVNEETLSEDQELSAVFDAAEASPEEFQAEETVETPDQPETTEAETEQPEDDAAGETPIEVPSDIPRSVTEHWADIPESARTAILESQRELSRKLGEQGRQMQGIEPIRATLVEAAQKLPSLAKMTPDAVAREIFNLAEVSQRFNDKPVETMLGLVKKHGLEQAMTEALGGNGVSDGARLMADMKNKISSLEGQLAQALNPDRIQQFIAQQSAQSEAVRSTAEFAEKAEHWGKVEAHIPHTIPIAQAKLGSSASSQDVLQAAYDLAVSQFVPEATKAEDAAAEQAASASDPEKTEAAIKAKSVNVRGQGSGKGRDLSEDQELSAIWDRAQ